MKGDSILISPVSSSMRSGSPDPYYTVIWIQQKVIRLQINEQALENTSNAIFFLSPDTHWEITANGEKSSGYLMRLSRETMNHPLLRNLHINEVRLFSNGEIPKISLAPGIEKRTRALLEMIDELTGSHLNHKEDAIISLLNAFFVYCDGQCNIKSIISDNSAKKKLVYKFKTLIDDHLGQYQKVADFARLLNVSPRYLNESVQEILNVNAKMLINEQLLMRARRDLKFSDKSVKEISFELGFSSPDYFSYFFKKHTGNSPSSLRG